MDVLSYHILHNIPGTQGFCPYWPTYADSSILEGKYVTVFNHPESIMNLVHWIPMLGDLESLPNEELDLTVFQAENPPFAEFAERYLNGFDWVFFDQDASMEYNGFEEIDALDWLLENSILEKCLLALQENGNAVLRVSPEVLDSPEFSNFRQFVLEEMRLKMVQLTDLYHGKYNRVVLWIENTVLATTTFYPKPHHKPDFIWTEMKNAHADQWLQIGIQEPWTPAFQDKYNKFIFNAFEELSCPNLGELIFDWIQPEYPPAENATIKDTIESGWVRVLNIQNLYEQSFAPNHKTLQFPMEYVSNHRIPHCLARSGDVVCWIGLPSPRYEQTPVMIWPITEASTEPVLLPPHTIVMRIGDTNSEVFQILQKRDIQFYLRNQIRRSGLHLRAIEQLYLPIPRFDQGAL